MLLDTAGSVFVDRNWVASTAGDFMHCERKILKVLYICLPRLEEIMVSGRN